MKKIVSVLSVFLILAALVPTVVSAKSVEFTYKVLSDGTACITDHEGDLSGVTELVVPSKIDGYNVTVYKDSLWDEEDIKTIEFPDTVKRIDAEFEYLNDLKSVKFPKNLKTIPSYLFYRCGKLEKIQFPEKLKKIASYAFRSCGLSDLKLPDSVTYVGESAFYNCNLKNITIPAGLKRIGAGAFKSCGLENATLNIPDTVRIIRTSAFNSCGFSEVNIGKNVRTISAKSFINNYNLKKFTVSEDNKYFTAVDGVLFTKDMKTLVHYPDAKDGESYTIPDGVERIEGCAFAYSNLKNVTFGADVKNAANKSFKLSKMLENVTFNEGLKRIGIQAFNRCENLKEVNIPNGVSVINESTFYACQNLAKVTLPAQLQSIDDDAFNSCYLLSELNIPETVNHIGSFAFSFTNIEKITIPNAPNKNFDCALASMRNLSEVTLLNPNANYKNFFGWWDYYWEDEVKAPTITLGDKNCTLSVGENDELDSKVFANIDDAEITVSDDSVIKAEIVDDAFISVDGLKEGTATITLKSGFLIQHFNVTVE